VRERITRCNICKKTDCNGKEYIVPWCIQGLEGGEGTWIVCSSQTKMKGETRVYEVICGHGISAKFVAFTVPEPIEIA